MCIPGPRSTIITGYLIFGALLVLLNLYLHKKKSPFKGQVLLITGALYVVVSFLLPSVAQCS